MWGHDTAVAETTVRDFHLNWTGTGLVINQGIDDTEALELLDGEYMVSEIASSELREVAILYNVYDSGDTITLEYRHASTELGVSSAGWNSYTGPFISLGFIQVRVTY